MTGYWIPMVCFAVHLLEEAPHFPRWASKHFAPTSTVFYCYSHIVLALIIVLICTLAAAAEPRSVWPWLAMTGQWVLCMNAVFHAVATIAFREYSPGLLTGAGLSIPGTAYLLTLVVTADALTPLDISSSMLLGTAISIAIVASLWLPTNIGWQLNPADGRDDQAPTDMLLAKQRRGEDMNKRTLLGAGLTFLPACASSRTARVHDTIDAQAAFAALQTLVGHWAEADSPDATAPETVAYQILARGSVLAESWSLRSGATSLTLYYLDRDVLFATHYCPQGNQPRLRLLGLSEGGLFFQLHDGAGLQDADLAHQHQFWISVDDPSSFRRAELYVQNGQRPPAGSIGGSSATRYVRQPE